MEMLGMVPHGIVQDGMMQHCVEQCDMGTAWCACYGTAWCA